MRLQYHLHRKDHIIDKICLSRSKIPFIYYHRMSLIHTLGNICQRNLTGAGYKCMVKRKTGLTHDVWNGMEYMKQGFSSHY